MITRMDTPQSVVIRLQPNSSSSGISRLLFLIVVGGTTLLVAIGWAVVGVWFILPFAGLEILVLVWATRKVALEARFQQVITLTDTEIKIESGSHYPEQENIFPSTEVYLDIVEAPTNGASRQLWLTSGKDKLQIGFFLNEEDTNSLIAQLKAYGLMVCRDRWWEQR